MCRSVSLFDGNAAYTLQILIYSAKGGVNKRRFDMVAGMTLPSLLKPVTLIPPPPPPSPMLRGFGVPFPGSVNSVFFDGMMSGAQSTRPQVGGVILCSARIILDIFSISKNSGSSNNGSDLNSWPIRLG